MDNGSLFIASNPLDKKALQRHSSKSRACSCCDARCDVVEFGATCCVRLSLARLTFLFPDMFPLAWLNCLKSVVKPVTERFENVGAASQAHIWHSGGTEIIFSSTGKSHFCVCVNRNARACGTAFFVVPVKISFFLDLLLESVRSPYQQTRHLVKPQEKLLLIT